MQILRSIKRNQRLSSGDHGRILVIPLQCSSTERQNETEQTETL